MVFVLAVLLEVFEMVKLDMRLIPVTSRTCSWFTLAVYFHVCSVYRQFQPYSPTPWKLLGKTFVLINDTGNSDVKIYAMKHRSSPKQILLVVCAVCFTASCVSIIKHFFFLSSLSRLRNQLPGVFTMDNADRISLSREQSKSAKVLLTVCFIRCNIISFVLKKGSA